MRRLVKCPECKSKPKRWTAKLSCGNCGKAVEVCIDPSIVFDPQGWSPTALINNARVVEAAPKSNEVKSSRKRF